MNYCYVDGFVISDINFKFFYSVGKNSPVSEACFKIKNNNQYIFVLKGFNEIADMLYRQIIKGDYILIEGIIKSNYIQVVQFNFTKCI